MNIHRSLKQTQGQVSLLLVVIAVVGAYFYHQEVYTPAVPQLAADSVVWQRLSADNKTVRASLAQMGVPRLQKRIRMYDKLRTELDALVPPSDSLVMVMRRLDERAEQTGVVVSAIRPDSQSVVADYYKRSYKITTISTWNQLGDFLARLASARHLVRPSKLKLMPAKPSELPRDYTPRGTPLKATFVVETFWHVTPRDSSDMLHEMNTVFGAGLPASMIASEIPVGQLPTATPPAKRDSRAGPYRPIDAKLNTPPTPPSSKP